MNPDYSKYKEILVVDGYKKLRNLKSLYNTTCVCVGKVQRTIFIIDIRITTVWLSCTECTMFAFMVL